MKKDLNWFKEQLDDIEMNTSSLWSHDSIWMLDIVNELLDELDEPDEREQLEVAYKDILSRREFLFDDKKYVVVEKRTVEEEWVMEWLDNNDFYDHRTAETVLANAVDKGELSYYGTKYSVVKKEPGTVEEVVADFGRSLERLRKLWRNIGVEELEESKYSREAINNYYNGLNPLD